MFPINILLVEDNPGDVFLIHDLLQHTQEPQFHVTTVGSLQAAFDCLDRDVFDLALLDLGLPDSQGLNTLLKFLDNAPTLPTVVLTGLNDLMFATQLVKQGAQDYLIKGELEESWLRNTITYTVARSRWIGAQQQQATHLQRSNRALQCQIRDYRSELTQMSEQLQALEARASTDALTQISNRYCFEKCFAQEWSHARETQRHLSLLIVELVIDLDDAHGFNDSCGYLWRDECLRQVAQYFKKTFNRPRDLVARYERQEFAVILPDMLMQGAVQMASDLYDGVQSLAIRHPNSDMSNWVSIRYGVASAIPLLNSTPAGFINDAERSLFLAKTGRFSGGGAPETHLASSPVSSPLSAPAAQPSSLAPSIGRLLA